MINHVKPQQVRGGNGCFIKSSSPDSHMARGFLFFFPSFFPLEIGKQVIVFGTEIKVFIIKIMVSPPG